MYYSFTLAALITTTLAAPSGINSEARWQPARRDTNLKFQNYQSDKFPYNIQISCGDAKRDNIINAVAEAGFLANQLYQTTPGSSYESTLEKYFGDKAKSSNDYNTNLKTPVENVYNLHEGRITANDHNIYMVCNPEEENLPACRLRVGATTYSTGPQKRDAIVVICNRFHDNQVSLGDLIKRQRSGGSVSATDLWGSRAGIMLHETYHMNPWIGVDGTSDYEDQKEDANKLIYGPKAVADLASRRNLEQTHLINDAYVSTAVSSYWQSMFNLGSVLEATDISDADPDTDPQVSIAQDYSVNQISYRSWTAQAATFNPLDYYPDDYPGNDCKPDDQKCNFVSSCGSHWMTNKDFNGIQGYETAVDRFCRRADMNWLVPGGKGTSEEQVALDGGKDPNKSGVTEGSVKFEINNKSKLDHFVNYRNCKDNLMFLATTPGPSFKGSKCYGGTVSDGGHDDTKGGTWQVGKSEISYHALPSKEKKHDELVAKFDVSANNGADDETDKENDGTILDVGN